MTEEIEKILFKAIKAKPNAFRIRETSIISKTCCFAFSVFKLNFINTCNLNFIAETFQWFFSVVV